MRAYYSGGSILAYCVTTALAAVWISFSFPNLSPYSITFVSFLVAFCIFAIMFLRTQSDIFRLSRKFPLEIFILNILTLCSWLFAFAALRKIEPSIECAVFQGCLPIAVLACDLITRKAKVLSLRTLGIALIGGCLLALLLTRLSLATGVVAHTKLELQQGIALAAIGGASAGIYAFRSGALHRLTGCSTIEMLCNRFVLLLIVTGYFGLGGVMQSIAIDKLDIFRLLALASISVVIPMFALQYSIQTLGASQVSIITPSVPVIALGIEQSFKGWPSAWIPILIVMTCFALLLANYWMNAEQLRLAFRLRPGQSEERLQP